MASTGITITLELDQALDEVVTSPAGSARLADGTRRTFQGWLGLTQAVDALARIRVHVTTRDPSNEEENR